MQNSPSRFRSRSAALLVTILFALSLIVSAQAQTVDIIHTFDAAAGEGSLPYSGLIEGAAGNFYGTTYNGGAHNFGTVYRLSPNGSGGWTETILYSFKGGRTDGAEPHASLFRDSAVEPTTVLSIGLLVEAV